MCAKMQRLINKTSPIPRYYQLGQILKKKITSGKFPPGSKFFSERRLMQEYKLSLTTVRQTLSELVKEGFLYREHGSGTYVRGFEGTERAAQVKDIGLICSSLSNPLFSEVVEKIESFAKKRGYHTILSITNGTLSDIKKSICSLKERGVPAIIAGPIYHGREELAYLSSLGEGNLRIVIFGCSEPTEVDYVTINRAKGAYEAVNYLVKLGHKNIAHAGISKSSCIWSKLSGFKKGLLDNGIKFNNSMLIESMGGEVNGYKAMKDVLEKREKPTAILAHDDLAAMGMMKAVKEAGLKVPDDFSIIGFDGIEASAYTEVPLTTVSQPKTDLAEKLVEVLEQKFRGKNIHNGIVLEPKLVIRDSCARRRD